MPIDPSTAFVSYAREDLEFVLRLAKDLKAKGAKVWMDKLDLRPGQRWENEVESALNACSRMLVIVSPASVASKNVLAEAAYAIDEGKEVIPVLLRDCKVPFRLRSFQYADFRSDYSVGLKELLIPLGVEQQESLVKLTVRGTYSNEELQSAQPWREIGHCRFHRDSEVAADPVFDLVVENTSGGSLLLLKIGIRILQRKEGTGGVMGYAQPIKVQAEYCVHCYDEWKRFNLNDKEVWKSFEDPLWMKKDDSPFRFTLCLKNFCDTDNASSSEIRFCLQTSSGTVESESIWLEQ